MARETDAVNESQKDAIEDPDTSSKIFGAKRESRTVSWAAKRR